MQFKTVNDWKQEIRRLFKEIGCSDSHCNNQADAFDQMYRNDPVEYRPEPQECFDAEVHEWVS